MFLRALRLLPEDLPWEAVVYSKSGIPTLRSSLRNRVTVVDDEDAAFAAADIVVAASLGQVTAPGVLVKALGVGAVPLAARVPVYEEVLREGDLGLHFQLGDVEVLAAQLERAIRDEALRAKLIAAGARGARGARVVEGRRPGGGASTRASRRSGTTRTPSPRSARGSRSTS